MCGLRYTELQVQGAYLSGILPDHESEGRGPAMGIGTVRGRTQPRHHGGECGSGIRILRQHPWETLISFIISQNNNIPRIKKIVESLCREFGEKIECGEQVLYAFPAPEALYNAGESAIFALKTGFRARYIYDAASRVVDGRLNIDALCEMDSDALNEALLEICGVGPKVAACVSLFGFGHTEAFPIDVWVKRIMQKYYPDGLDIKSLGRYAGVAQQYLFY